MFVLMVPVVPTGTLPDGHTGSHLKIVGPELQWWVPLAHSGSYWGGEWGPPEAMSTTRHSRLIASCDCATMLILVDSTLHS